MALQNTSVDSGEFRHRLKEIRLEPSKSSHDISITLSVDSKEVYKLPRVKDGRLLCWSDLCLPCDVSNTSKITIRITEMRMRNSTEEATYEMTQVTGKDTLKIGLTSICVMIQAERSYEKAFAKAWQMGSVVSVVGKAGRAGAAFKKLLKLGSAIAGLDPTGGAKVAFAVCAAAWEVCIPTTSTSWSEQQSTWAAYSISKRKIT
ncbi:hypothetical protein FRC10_007271, partial [Ceratobasidium sp. 414]